MSRSEFVIFEKKNNILIIDEILAPHFEILENSVITKPKFQVFNLIKICLGRYGSNGYGRRISKSSKY